MGTVPNHFFFLATASGLFRIGGASQSLAGERGDVGDKGKTDLRSGICASLVWTIGSPALRATSSSFWRLGCIAVGRPETHTHKGEMLRQGIPERKTRKNEKRK